MNAIYQHCLETFTYWSSSIMITKKKNRTIIFDERINNFKMLKIEFLMAIGHCYDNNCLSFTN